MGTATHMRGHARAQARGRAAMAIATQLATTSPDPEPLLLEPSRGLRQGYAILDRIADEIGSWDAVVRTGLRPHHVTLVSNRTVEVRLPQFAAYVIDRPEAVQVAGVALLQLQAKIHELELRLAKVEFDDQYKAVARVADAYGPDPGIELANDTDSMAGIRARPGRRRRAGGPGASWRRPRPPSRCGTACERPSRHPSTCTN